ncbi:MAG TPA: hypothetical protein VHN79_07190, partial [Lacunisphaera sp.]|nr:hypothetical protein [Lacunisphaera sp.]
MLAPHVTGARAGRVHWMKRGVHSAPWRIVLSLLVAGSFALSAAVPSLRAQTSAAKPAADPRVTADAARCLAIDTTLAELAGQARAGALGPEAYKQRAEALTAERTRITAAYGARSSPPHQGLVAEFNRLKAAAAAEARERAAAATRAKREAAAAEQKARREAAAAAAANQAQAKKEAAEAAAAEKARQADLAENAIFADVSAVADERLQRARDSFHRDFGLPAPTSAGIAAQQAAAAQAARARHVPPQRADLRPTFDQRVETLYQLRLPERRNGWFGEVFPDAGSITAAFSDDHEKTAALELATRRLSENTTGVRPYAVQQQLEAYQAARQGLKFDFTQVSRLTQDKEFEARVFEKSLPAYAANKRQQAARDKLAAQLEAQRRRANQMINLLTLLVMALGIGFPVYLMRSQKFRWKRQSRADWEKQMATTPLPENLWWIQVPGFRYPVALFSGRVYDKEVWTETNVTTTTTTTGGGGTGAYYTAPTYSTSTHVSTTVYHRYWLLTTEGRQTWQKYSDNEVMATAGQKLSSIWSDNYWVLIACNHATGEVSTPRWWTKTMHTQLTFGITQTPRAATSNSPTRARSN